MEERVDQGTGAKVRQNRGRTEAPQGDRQSLRSGSLDNAQIVIRADSQEESVREALKKIVEGFENDFGLPVDRTIYHLSPLVAVAMLASLRCAAYGITDTLEIIRHAQRMYGVELAPEDIEKAKSKAVYRKLELRASEMLSQEVRLRRLAVQRKALERLEKRLDDEEVPDKVLLELTKPKGVGLEIVSERTPEEERWALRTRGE